MITDGILGVVFNIVSSVLDKLPAIDVSMDFAILNTFLDIVGLVLYFFPWKKVVGILAIIVLLQTWRILITIIKTLWDLLPIV